MSLRFTPPKNEKLPRYASYGSGQMKTHTDIGHAKQSLGHRCGTYSWNSDMGWKEGFILELVDGEWYVRFHVKEGTKTDDLPWKTDAWKHDSPSWYNRGYVYHEPNYGKENYTKVRINKRESREEYAAWRLKVELERLGIDDEMRMKILLAKGE